MAFFFARSQTDLQGELNKLYLNSREKLHAITENPTEEILNNITHYMRLNSRFLSDCFNEANAYRYDIVDMVTERLTFQDVDDNSIPPKTDAKNMDSFFSSKGNYYYEKP